MLLSLLVRHTLGFKTLQKLECQYFPCYFNCFDCLSLHTQFLFLCLCPISVVTDCLIPWYCLLDCMMIPLLLLCISFETLLLGFLLLLSFIYFLLIIFYYIMEYSGGINDRFLFNMFKKEMSYSGQ